MGIMSIMNLDGAAGKAPPAPTPAALLPTLPSTVKDPAPAHAPAARRKIGVGRREIRTCAEGCYPKSKPLGHGQMPVLHSNAPPIKSAIVQGIIEREQRPAEPGATSVGTSAPGSVHDDADDESELSELDEGSPERVRREGPGVMFPGLENARGRGEEGEEEGEGDDGDDGDDEGDGEAEEEEEEGGAENEDVAMGDADGEVDGESAADVTRESTAVAHRVDDGMRV